MRFAQRAVARRGAAPGLSLRRDVSPGDGLQSAQPRYLLVLDPRQRMAAAQGGGRALARPRQFRCGRPATAEPVEAHSGSDKFPVTAKYSEIRKRPVERPKYRPIVGTNQGLATEFPYFSEQGDFVVVTGKFDRPNRERNPRFESYQGTTRESARNGDDR